MKVSWKRLIIALLLEIIVVIFGAVVDIILGTGTFCSTLFCGFYVATILPWIFGDKIWLFQ